MKLKMAAALLFLFATLPSTAQQVSLGDYPHVSLTSLSVDYSGMSTIKSITLSDIPVKTSWHDAYLNVEFTPTVKHFTTIYGETYNYLDFLVGGTARVTGTVTATWRIPISGITLTKTTSVNAEFNQTYGVLASDVIFPSNKEYFGKACEEIVKSGGVCSRSELAKRGYAPQLIGLKFEVEVTLSDKVEENLAALRNRKKMVEQGIVLYGSGKCEEAVQVFGEALQAVPQWLKQNLDLNDADIQHRIDDCQGKITAKAESDKVKLEKEKLLAEAQNAESSGSIDEAIGKYEALYVLDKDPSIKAKIDELKAKKQDEAEKAEEKAQAKPEAEKNGTEDGRTERTQQAAENFDHNIPRNEMSTELDFWGNPIVSKAEDGEAKTVSYAGMEVENNEQYQQQMQLRQNNAYAREQFQLQEAEKKQQIDNNNSAIYQQGNDIYQNSLNIESDFEEAKSQLDYGSGDALLKSSAALASTATNAADATTSLAGMGVGIIMKMGENAAKKRAAEEARAERERQRKAEEARIKAAKQAIKNARLKIFSSFPQGELPLSSTKSSGDNLYYFAYSYNDSQLTEQNPVVATVPVFAIGKYPDGTWPLQTKVEDELNTLVPAKKTICGPFYSPQEAVQVFNSFSKLTSQTQIQLKTVEYKGYNAHPENTTTTSQKAKVDFWGNPIKN